MLTSVTRSSIEKLQNSIIDLIPNHSILWKDRNSVFLGCNTTFATSLGFKSSEDIIGKTDFDLFTLKKEAEAYREDDHQVIDTLQPKLNIEEAQTLQNGKKKVLLTNKVPLLDEAGRILGVLAIYSDITQQKLNEKKLIEANKKLENLYKIKQESIKDINCAAMASSFYSNLDNRYKLSRRHKECLYYLTKGMTFKQIARILNLSPRTIEHHIEYVKIKLGCFSRTQLIEKITML